MIKQNRKSISSEGNSTAQCAILLPPRRPATKFLSLPTINKQAIYSHVIQDLISHKQ